MASEGHDISENMVNEASRDERLLGLLRLVRFAQQEALELKAEFPAYCLGLTVGALVEDIAGMDAETFLRAARSAEPLGEIFHGRKHLAS